jgi:hypothetical protein
MAQGTITMFEEYSLTIGTSIFQMATNTFKLALVTTDPTAALATPIWADISANEVSGTNYTAGGETLTTTWLEAGGTATFDETGTPGASWTQHASGPTDIKYGVIYSDTATNDDLVCYIDFTTDGGTTAISLVTGDITWTANASGVFTLG